MKSIWFKQMYVNDILTGVKKDTIRRQSAFSKYDVDEVVQLQVGPRKPFAIAITKSVRQLQRNMIPNERLLQLDKIYGFSDFFTIIEFKVIKEL